MQKDIQDSKPLFKKYINLGIGIQTFKEIKLLFTRYAFIYTTI